MRKARIVLGLLAALVAVAAVAAVSIAPARAAGVCANYVSDTRASATTSVTVTFQVYTNGCVVSLVSYESRTSGHFNEQYATGTFNAGTHTLTVPVTCGTDNQVDLFLGSPPLVLTGPNTSPDLYSFGFTPQCSPPPSVCTYTKGYYKNHLSAVQSYYAASGLAGYGITEAQAEAILTASPSKLPAGQGGALNLAQQVVTALLNGGKGASLPSNVSSAISAAIAGLNISYGAGGKVTSVTASGIDVGGLSSTIEPFNSATDCG